jgi:hypothetical protein
MTLFYSIKQEGKLSGMIQTIHMRIIDDIFKNRKGRITTPSTTQKTGVLSEKAGSYFRQITKIQDMRDVRNPAPLFGISSKPELVIDALQYSDFLAALESQDVEVQNSIFSVIDRVLFKYSSIIGRATLDDEMTTDIDLYSVFVPTSLIISPTTKNSTIYLEDGSTGTILCPTYCIFRIQFLTQADPVVYELKIWLDDDEFLLEYPVVYVEKVTSIISLDRVLSDSLIGFTGNILEGSANAQTRIASDISPLIASADSSGILLFNVKAYDTSNNTRMIPFTLLYKGREPDRVYSRYVIRKYIEDSGIGTLDEWKRRIPELYIDSRFTIVPLWKNITELPDRKLFRNSVSVNEIRLIAKSALGEYDADYIDNELEVFPVVYDKMIVLSVPHQMNPDSKTSIYKIHPTYQAYETTNPNYNSIDVLTRQFMVHLSAALSVAAGNSTDPAYREVVDSHNTYISFDVGFTEYLIMTPLSYTLRVGTVVS